MRNIMQDIKNGTFHNMYLLYGVEGYLKKQYRNKLKQAICGEDTMNYAYFEGKGIKAENVISIAETIPFFAERRLVVVENSGFFKNANEKLCLYLDELPQSTILLFVEEEIDKRSKMFKKVKEKGYVCEMAEQTASVLGKWVVQLLGDAGKKVTRDTLDYFLAIVGTDMNHISNEVEKLISYTEGREAITIEDINDICSATVVGKLFDMIDAMGNKNKTKALRLYYDMIEVKEPPMRILYMLSRQFHIMLQAKELKRAGAEPKSIAAKIGMAPFIVNKALRQSERFSDGTIKQALRDCLQVEEDVKNGRLEDKMGVEMILITYTRQASET